MQFVIDNAWLNMPVSLLSLGLLIALHFYRKSYPTNMYAHLSIHDGSVLSLLEAQGGLVSDVA